jgi:ribosome biogenesis protein SSF1/2
MKITFQNMFRTINVKTVKLGDCRRVVLFHYNKEEGQVQMRHYAIRANPVGISRNVKKLVQSKLPNLSELSDISQFLDSSTSESAANFYGALSDSEAEEEGSRVTLPDRYVGRGNAKSQLSAMKLIELGPRLTLELYKVQQGMNEGDILYHKFVQKTPEEAAATKARVEKARILKEQRKQVQEQNVKRKRDAVEAIRQEKAERKKQKLENGEAGEQSDDEDDDEEVEDFDEEEGDYGDEEDNEDFGDDDEEEEQEREEEYEDEDEENGEEEDVSDDEE